MPSTGPTIAEFQLIERLAALGADASGVVLGIGDDAAVLTLPPGHLLVTCTDTLVGGVHFPAQASAADIGWKSLAVNLSDLAAMGATPRWAQLSLTLPEADVGWVDGFIEGWLELARESRICLVGGDTSRGPLSVTVQLLGQAREQHLICRSGAKPGDLLGVTGTLGAASLALSRLLAGEDPGEALARRLHRPRPRTAAGLALRGLASACIDLSDGLAGDLAHLVNASGVAAEVEVSRIPVDPALDGLESQQRLNLATGGGDDYELCFSVAPDRRAAVSRALADCGVDWQPIGHVGEGDGIHWSGLGSLTVPDAWRHFADQQDPSVRSGLS